MSTKFPQPMVDAFDHDAWAFTGPKAGSYANQLVKLFAAEGVHAKVDKDGTNRRVHLPGLSVYWDPAQGDDTNWQMAFDHYVRSWKASIAD